MTSDGENKCLLCLVEYAELDRFLYACSFYMLIHESTGKDESGG